ncbi:hypothetical protein [Deinococcus ruber]|nr:hypothetical protein [Deinococcus ruber]
MPLAKLTLAEAVVVLSAQRNDEAILIQSGVGSNVTRDRFQQGWLWAGSWQLGTVHRIQAARHWNL